MYLKMSGNIADFSPAVLKLITVRKHAYTHAHTRLYRLCRSMSTHVYMRCLYMRMHMPPRTSLLM